MYKGAYINVSCNISLEILPTAKHQGMELILFFLPQQSKELSTSSQIF